MKNKIDNQFSTWKIKSKRIKLKNLWITSSRDRFQLMKKSSLTRIKLSWVQKTIWFGIAMIWEIKWWINMNIKILIKAWKQKKMWFCGSRRFSRLKKFKFWFTLQPTYTLKLTNPTESSLSLNWALFLWDIRISSLVSLRMINIHVMKC